MLKTPTKISRSYSNIFKNKSPDNMSQPSLYISPQPAKQSETVVLENGTMMGAVTTAGTVDQHLDPIIPEIIISACQSSNSLFGSRSNGIVQKEHTTVDTEETVAERTALLETNSDGEIETDEFEQFLLNRTTSDSNVLDSSIYSELQFSSTDVGDGAGAANRSGRSTLLPLTQSTATSTGTDVVNASLCSRESRPNKRMRRKHKSKSKCIEQRVGSPVDTPYLPQYTAIFLDAHHASANAMGQITSTTMTSPFVNGAPMSAAEYNCQRQHLQFFQQQPVCTTLGRAFGHHIPRTLVEVSNNSRTVSFMCAETINGSTDFVGGASGTTVTPSIITPPLRSSFRKWFSRPSLPFVIGILALGGVACTLGGIVLGSTGLIEHSTQYLSAALLMIGIGVSLLVISGAIWRLSLPDDVDECACYRRIETCRNCNSPYCTNRLLAGSYLYPEFQHRPPPPSYLTSLNECAAMGFLFHPAAQPQQTIGVIRGNTPPPLYRSTNSLSAFAPTVNVLTAGTTASLATQPPPAASVNSRNTDSFPNQGTMAMSSVIGSLQAQTQIQLAKEINYLELD